MKFIILITTVGFLTLSCSPKTYACSGYDYNKGKYVDIEKGSIVREGNDIEIFDYDKGEYKTVEVESVDNREVIYTDPDTGESITINMD